ncbi:Hypothetical predicted protein [Olea europaea subsp. europaea]|uniref:Uncharacterized protein n=1 Tax=Olea europaea subsp. europaea TaxID=158383 RepID=A0A8S0PEC0_OLEEU|nr:Hypothetical predicted protein [Olea europaea subsp. europaea]
MKKFFFPALLLAALFLSSSLMLTTVASSACISAEFVVRSANVCLPGLTGTRMNVPVIGTRLTLRVNQNALRKVTRFCHGS